MTYPETVIIELSSKCNLQCVFCSAPWFAVGSKYDLRLDMSFVQWQQAIDKLESLGVKNISFSGGESIMNPILLDLIGYINLKGCLNKKEKIGVISNGKGLTAELLTFFADNNIHLSISCPGIKTYEWHTKNNNLEKVLWAFEYARKIGLTTTANVPVTKKNLCELFEILSMVILSGANLVLINRFLPGGRGLSNYKELCLNRFEINEMLDIAEEVLGYANMIGYTGTEIPLCIIDNKEKYKHIIISSLCGAAKSFFVIDSSGYIRVCNHSERKIGHILSDNIIDDFDYWNLFYSSAYKPAYCKKCEDFSKCDCGCREVANIVNGSCSDIDPIINYLRL